MITEKNVEEPRLQIFNDVKHFFEKLSTNYIKKITKTTVENPR